VYYVHIYMIPTVYYYVSPWLCACVFSLTTLSPLGQLCSRHPQYVTQLEGPLFLCVAGPLPAPQEAAPRGHHNKSVVGVQIGRHCFELDERKRKNNNSKQINNKLDLVYTVLWSKADFHTLYISV
jgi:hypothetical protein